MRARLSNRFPHSAKAALRLGFLINQHWLKEEIVLKNECSVTQPIFFFSQGWTTAGFPVQPWLEEKNRLADRALISKNDEMRR
jgi:hypothetical protein